MDSGIKKDKAYAPGGMFRFIAAVILVMVVTMQILSYSSVTAGFKKIHYNCNASLAASAAENIDGDIFESVIDSGKGSAEYNYIFYMLSGYMQAARGTYVYAMARSDEGVLKYVAGAYPPGHREFGGEYDVEPGMLTASAPIHNSKMEIVGIIGVDSSVKDVTKSVNAFMLKVFISASAGILICVLFVAIVMVKLRKRRSKYNAGVQNANEIVELKLIGESLNMLGNTDIRVNAADD